MNTQDHRKFEKSNKKNNGNGITGEDEGCGSAKEAEERSGLIATERRHLRRSEF